MKPDAILAACLCERAVETVGEMASEELGMLVWALGVLDLRPEARVLASLSSTTLVQLEKPDEVVRERERNRETERQRDREREYVYVCMFTHSLSHTHTLSLSLSLSHTHMDVYIHR